MRETGRCRDGPDVPMTRHVAPHLLLALSLSGYLGGLLGLVAYGLVSSGRLSPTSVPAVATSSVGAVLMIASGVVVEAWPSVGVNAVWVVLGVAGARRARAAARTTAVDRTPAAPVDAAPAAPRWADDWDTAAEQLSTGAVDVVPAPAGGDAAWTATRPLPVLDAAGRPVT